MVARYQVRDPAEWALHGPLTDDVLRVETAAAVVRSLGEMGVDRVLSDGRKDLIAAATKRVQQGLDAAHAGIELTSLELTNLAPPSALASDFDAVQTAFIGAETKKKEAQAFAEAAIPQAQSDADSDLQAARGAAAADLAKAKGEGRAFVALADQYHASPAVVRERLYRDTVDKSLALAKVRWVPPPPPGGKNENLRVQLGGHQGAPTMPTTTKQQRPE
jgi:membrane protease subunit HflK